MQKPVRVLVVEDDDATREALLIALGEGFAVDGVRDLEQGLRWAIATEPDVIVLDLGLDPEHPARPDGAQFVTRLEARGRSVPPVIVVSGRPDAGIIASSIGAIAYFPKPFDLDQLIERIRVIASRKANG